MLLFLITLSYFGGVQNGYNNNACVCAHLAGEREIKKYGKSNAACFHVLFLNSIAEDISIFCITFTSHFLNTGFLLGSLKFHIISLSRSWDEMCHPCDPGHSGRSLYRSSAIAICVGRSSKFDSVSSHRTAHSFNTRADGHYGQLKWWKKRNKTWKIRSDSSNPRWKIGPANENSEKSLIRKWQSTLCADHPLFTCLYRFSSGSDRERENLGFPFAVLLKSTLSCHRCSGNRMQIKPSVTKDPKPHKISPSRPHMHICVKTPLGRKRGGLYSFIYCSKEW